MPSLFESVAELFDQSDDRVYGVAVATVVDNIDQTGEARVQVKLPWLPGFQPWARVAAAAAGDKRGLFLIPHVGDEVLVAFDQGDVREPYVLGSLWNGQDSPPADSPTDARSKTILKTGQGHVIELDDNRQSITITSATGQKVSLTTEAIEVEADQSKATFGKSGNISIKAGSDLKLEGSTVSIKGSTVDINADASATLKASGACTIKGSTVEIN